MSSSYHMTIHVTFCIEALMYKFHRVEKKTTYARKRQASSSKRKRDVGKLATFVARVFFLCVTSIHERVSGEKYRTLCSLLRDGYTRAEAAYCEIRTGYFSATGDTGVSALRATRASDVPLRDVLVRSLARMCRRATEGCKYVGQPNRTRGIGQKAELCVPRVENIPARASLNYSVSRTSPTTRFDDR